MIVYNCEYLRGASFITHKLFNDEQEERRANRVAFREANRRIRMLRDTSNPFDVPVHYFVEFYRMDQVVTWRLIRLLEPRLIGDRSTAVPIHLQVLITLRFMAEGGNQKGLCREFNHPVGQTTASKYIEKVQEAILHLRNIAVRFPTDHRSREMIQNKTIRIPGIIGAVDGFLVSFKRPSENEEVFFDYRVGCAMNVQIIVDSDYNILNIRICPGSNNDRFVWQYSQAKEYVEYLRNNQDIVEREGRYYLSGDSGYTLSPSVLTPILEAEDGSPASLYTAEHVGTRRYVEQTIGILTNVWRAIKRYRALYYAPDAVARIINVACILHNFRKKNGIFDNVNQQQNIVIGERLNGENADHAAGVAERQRLVDKYYT